MFDPIYTEPKQCQDCYKCVRECAIKSIRFEGEQKAFIMPDACIYCGHCVDVCPVRAKKIRSDLLSVKRWIDEGQEVVAALAPSIIADFKNVEYGQLLSAIKKLGFSGIVEVSTGAHIITREIAKHLKVTDQAVSISTACPSVVFLIQKYYPQLATSLVPFQSPALAVSSEVKKKHGNVRVVFIGPCIAKMKEADLYPELTDAAIGFVELREWFTENQVDPSQEKANYEMLLDGQGTGRLYPIDGGMCEALTHFGAQEDAELLSFSGMHRIKQILDNLVKQPRSNKKIFLELLACEGGCLQGPLSNKESCLIEKILTQKEMIEERGIGSLDCPETTTTHHLEFPATPLDKTCFTESEIREALKSIGKEQHEDELNCSGCGHETCRDFALAMLSGKANHTMCVSYMRKLAANKANVLIKAMPCGIVIVDHELRILEANDKFTDLLDQEIKQIKELRGSLQAMLLSKVIPFSQLFNAVLDTNEEILDKEIQFQGRILTVSIFPIEKNRIVGGFIQDVTQPFVQREQIIKKANEIIIKNLTTVQKIAYLLGENAAESEVLINSIVKSFSHNTEK